MFKAWAFGTYLFFAVFLAVGGFWVWWYLPETKGATLEEMDSVFGSHSSELDARLLEEAQDDVGLSLYLRGLRRVGEKEGNGVVEQIV